MGTKKPKSPPKTKRKYERDIPVSLAPLDFMTALGALVKVDPKGLEPAPKHPAVEPRKS